MLSRELDEAITLLRSNDYRMLNCDIDFARKLGDLLLVCAAQGDVVQAVAETVARSINKSAKEEQGQIELRHV